MQDDFRHLFYLTPEDGPAGIVPTNTPKQGHRIVVVVNQVAVQNRHIATGEFFHEGGIQSLKRGRLACHCLTIRVDRKRPHRAGNDLGNDIVHITL